MATTDLSQAPMSADRQGQCPARTARGMRTPTGDYMTCAGDHAVGDPHGAPFGNAGWFTWTDGTDDTAPLPPAAADVARRLEFELASPVDLLRARIARLEESIWIQNQGLNEDLARMRNVALSELDRASLEGSFHSTLREIHFLQHQLRELTAELEAATRFQAAASTCRMLSAQAVWIAPGEYDRLLNAQDEMAMCRCQLAAAGRLDLIEAS